MGTLYYGEARRPIKIDDRVLTHIKIVILGKLRRNEGFALSWDKTVADGSGRHTVWMHPSIALEFEFVGSIQPALNREWLEELSVSASSSSGLHVTPERTRH